MYPIHKKKRIPNLSGFGGFLLGLGQQLFQFLNHLPRLLLLHSELLQPDALVLLLKAIAAAIYKTPVKMHGGSIFFYSYRLDLLIFVECMRNRERSYKVES